jgi:CheY-like chemotaxis protein
MLENLGCQVTVVDNGQEALSALEKHFYDIVFMDWQMPELDGLTTTRLIRAKEAHSHSPHLPIIALTANAIEGDRQRCLAVGMDDYLGKPFNQEQLFTVLQRWAPATSCRRTLFARPSSSSLRFQRSRLPQRSIQPNSLLSGPYSVLVNPIWFTRSLSNTSSRPHHYFRPFTTPSLSMMQPPCSKPPIALNPVVHRLALFRSLLSART